MTASYSFRKSQLVGGYPAFITEANCGFARRRITPERIAEDEHIED